MNSEKKVMAYQVRKVDISTTWEGNEARNEDARYLFHKGWQPWGRPFGSNNGVYQAFVKYEE